METPQNDARWEDIVFENRNRVYGAYVLRTNYTRNLLRAGMGTALLLAVSFTAPVLAKFFGSEKVVIPKKPDVVVVLDRPPLLEVRPPQVRIVIERVPRTLKFVAPKVTANEIEDEVPAIDALSRVETSTETMDGTETPIFDEPVEAVVAEPEDTGVHLFAEQPPQFPGGMRAMSEFIKRNLKYPNRARQLGTEGKVYVQFIVNKDGTISDVSTIKGISADCDQEAARVVSIMPSWTAGKQNGKTVRVKFVVPVNYMFATN